MTVLSAVLLLYQRVPGFGLRLAVVEVIASGVLVMICHAASVHLGCSRGPLGCDSAPVIDRVECFAKADA